MVDGSSRSLGLITVFRLFRESYHTFMDYTVGDFLVFLFNCVRRVVHMLMFQTSLHDLNLYLFGCVICYYLCKFLRLLSSSIIKASNVIINNYLSETTPPHRVASRETKGSSSPTRSSWLGSFLFSANQTPIEITAHATTRQHYGLKKFLILESTSAFLDLLLPQIRNKPFDFHLLLRELRYLNSSHPLVIYLSRRADNMKNLITLKRTVLNFNITTEELHSRRNAAVNRMTAEEEVLSTRTSISR